MQISFDGFLLYFVFNSNKLSIHVDINKIFVNNVKIIKTKIAVNNKFVERTVETIIETARHGDGQIGDGKIFITNLEECIRIRTGDKGEQAI